MPELLAALVRQATKTATVRQIGSVSNITVFPMEQKKAPHSSRPARNGRQEAVWGAIPTAQGRPARNITN